MKRLIRLPGGEGAGVRPPTVPRGVKRLTPSRSSRPGVGAGRLSRRRPERLIRLQGGEGSESGPCRSQEGSSVGPLPIIPAERERPDDDRDDRARTSSTKGVRVGPPSANESRQGLSAQPPASDPEREALIDDAIALFGPRYQRAISREEARQMMERLTAFFSLLASWDRRRRGGLEENDRAA